jgi:multiple sugar transport system permease protein
LVGFLLFQLGPLVASAVFSFMRYDIITPGKFVGLGNYQNLLPDPLFWKSLWNTVYYVGGSVPLRIVVALALALALNQSIVGKGIFRTIFYVPSIVTGVALGMLWLFMFQPDYGLVNALLAKVGIRGPSWLGSPVWAMPSMIIVALWGMGPAMVIFLACLQGIPTTYYEAARIDGASGLSMMIRITLPLLSPAIFLNVVVSVISAFQVFAKAYIMTAGGPLDSTLVYVLYLYRVGFQYFRMGYGSALAWVLFVIIFGLTLLQFRMSSWVHYES